MALTTVRPEGLGFVNGKRNLIINGAMQVAQRGTSATVGNGNFVCDRFRLQNTTIGSFTASQSTNAPDGFSNSTRIYCDTAEASPAASDIFVAGYRFEGQDLQQLQKGSSSAKSITLSFWVRSNKTGTYCMYLFDNDTASYRSYSTSYSISSANTWTYVTHTFAGDTSGALDNDANRSLDLTFGLATGTDYSSGTLSNAWQAHDATDILAGQTNLADTVGNFWEITAVQLEVGENATPFEHRSYGEELALCQRYFTSSGSDQHEISWGGQNTSSIAGGMITLPIHMRASCTVSTRDASSNAQRFSTLTGGGSAAHNVSFNVLTGQKSAIYFRCYNEGLNGMKFSWEADAEL